MKSVTGKEQHLSFVEQQVLEERQLKEVSLLSSRDACLADIATVRREKRWRRRKVGPFAAKPTDHEFLAGQSSRRTIINLHRPNILKT